MSAAQVPQEKKVSLNERLNEFIQKHRMKLIAGLISIVVILAGIIIYSTVNEKLRTSALGKVDALEQRYEELKMYLSGEDPEALLKQGDITALLEDLDTFSSRNSGFAAARAYAISGTIFSEQKKWTEAEKAFIASADAAPKAYLAPISIYNAAVAAEEQKNIQGAIDLFTRSMNYENSFAARSQFSIGRLEESRNNKSGALEAYRILVSKWPSDPVWANLAQSRIVVLSD